MTELEREYAERFDTTKKDYILFFPGELPGVPNYINLSELERLVEHYHPISERYKSYLPFTEEEATEQKQANVILDALLKAFPVNPARFIRVRYTNYRGETSVRVIQPYSSGMKFASNKYHPVPQWLMDVLDVDRGVERTFALKDMIVLDNTCRNPKCDEVVNGNVIYCSNDCRRTNTQT